MKANTQLFNTCRGISAVEMLVGISIAAFILIFTTHTIVRFVNVGRDITEKTQALYLAEDALELVRFIRDDSWASISGLTDGTTYYLDVDASSVSVSATPEVIGNFTRSFVIDTVERNGNDDIVASGSGDSGSRYVTATVEWGNPTTSVALTTILTDIDQP